MSELLHYIKLRNVGNCNKKESECDKYLDCESCLEDKIKKHDIELLNKVAEKFIAWDSKVKGIREDKACFFIIENILKGIEEMKTEVNK